MYSFFSLLRVAIALLLAVIFSGCTSLVMKDISGAKAPADVEVSRTYDEIVAMGAIANPEVLEKFPEAMALIGKNQTYILLKGSKDLQAIANGLDANLLEASSVDGFLGGMNDPLVFSTKDQEFFGTTWMRYRKKADQLSPKEKQVISSIAGVRTAYSSGYQVIPIRVSGIIPTQPVVVSDTVTRFKIGRKIALVKTDKRESWVKYPNPFAIFALPFAIVGDALLLPVLVISGGH